MFEDKNLCIFAKDYTLLYMYYSGKDIWNVSYPILLALLAQNIINVTDTAFLGHVGEVELGASAMGGLLYICIFTVAFFIYLYFFITVYGKLKNVRESTERFRLTKAQLFGAILFLVGGIIYLVVEISETEEVDIAII